MKSNRNNADSVEAKAERLAKKAIGITEQRRKYFRDKYPDIAKLVDKFRQEGFEARVSLKPRQYRKAGKTHCGIGLLEFIA